MGILFRVVAVAKRHLISLVKSKDSPLLDCSHPGNKVCSFLTKTESTMLVASFAVAESACVLFGVHLHKRYNIV